jgi:replicative DNA helicase
MTKKDNFKNLPEREINPPDMPRPARGFLAGYYNSLGSGELELLGIKTGFNQLNEATCGLEGLIVLGGEPGQGKTSFALQLAFDVAKETPAIFYSLEMPRRAVLTKILSRLAGVNRKDILLKGKPSLAEGLYSLALTTEADSKLKEGKALLEGQSGKLYIRTRERSEGEKDISFETLEAEISSLKVSHKTERVFVVIDHLQVFPAKGQYRDQIDKEGQLINEFKGISERTGAIILLISQKNKAAIEGDKATFAAIKGSVDIIYLADIVMFLEDGKDHKEAGGQKEVKLKIIKNRYDMPKDIDYNFNGEFSRFEESNHPF